jgi:hypothetical protein
MNIMNKETELKNIRNITVKDNPQHKNHELSFVCDVKNNLTQKTDTYEISIPACDIQGKLIEESSSVNVVGLGDKSICSYKKQNYNLQFNLDLFLAESEYIKGNKLPYNIKKLTNDNISFEVGKPIDDKTNRLIDEWLHMQEIINNFSNELDNIKKSIK